MKDKCKGSSPFPSTHWSLVEQAGHSDLASRQKALDTLLREYLPVLKSYIVQAYKVESDIADDYLQGFITDKILGYGLVKRADQKRGKFRNLILKSLNNYIATEIGRKKRQPVIVNDLEEQQDPYIQQDVFDREWASKVVQGALRAMKKECEDKLRHDIWDIFECRVVKVAFGEEPETPYEKLIQQFNLESPRQAINLLSTAKRMFNRNLRSEVERYLESSEDIDAEICDLREIFLQARATFE